MAQALSLFDSRHLLIITSFDSWCGQMNEDLGLQVIVAIVAIIAILMLSYQQDLHPLAARPSWRTEHVVLHPRRQLHRRLRISFGGGYMIGFASSFLFRFMTFLQLG